MAALNSNQPTTDQNRSNSAPQSGIPNNGSNNNFFQSPIQQAPSSGKLSYGADDSPYIEFDGEFDDSYNYDMNGDQMIGDLPGSITPDDEEDEEEEADLHEKRKNSDGKEDDDQGGGKRREGEDKTAKKPGRKPLMSEPTSVSTLDVNF